MVCKANNRDYQRFQSALDRSQGDLHPTLGAILATHEQAPPLAHGSRPTVVAEAKAMSDVREPKARRHQQLDELALKIVRGVPKETSQVLVRKANTPRFVNDH